MKRILRLIFPINRDKQGSMTLEAALVMPVFVLVVLFLIYVIYAAKAAMALHGALSQTVRQAASSWYSISAGLETIRAQPLYRQTKEWSDRLEKVGNTVEPYARYLPGPIAEWTKQAADGQWSPDAIAATRIFDEWLKREVDESVLRREGLKVTGIGLPASNGGVEEAYLTVEAEYRLPFRFPFVGRTLVLHQSARERVWIGGEKLPEAQLDQQTQPTSLFYVSLEPNPVRRGNRVTLTLRATPGATVDLSVIYKSGLSQAKHLGTATADSSGLVKWTWLVSGNTTPGEWEWEARTGTESPIRQIFNVQSRQGGASP